jgi:hypothetical protein
MRPARRRLVIALASLAWAMAVLYPNPALLARAVVNARDPDIDPAAVAAWAATLPDDPEAVEAAVLGRYVPYAVPWQTRGVPWYFPTTAEVVADGSGDCQGRMLVLASLLEAKGIPYTLRASLDHIWIEYPKKRPNGLENPAIAIMDDGRLRVPERWDWRETYRIEREYFWDFMPLGRRLLLLGGLAAIWWGRSLLALLRRVRPGRAGRAEGRMV